MPKYLIEVPHSAEIRACAEAIKIFLETGSHFLANAEWGCEDGEHKCWLVVEVEDKTAARNIIPPNFRHNASITQLTRFTMKEIDEILDSHSPK
jgi:hypothetical protein